MNQQNNFDYSQFGGTKEDAQPSGIDYSQFGGSPEVKTNQGKVGKTKSVLYGAAEGLLGIPALVQYGVNEWSKALESKDEGEEQPSFEKENPLLNIINQFPESETEAGRRLRVGTSGTIMGGVGGIPGIIAGIVGSQAGQTIREVYGKEGKFEEFGAGEIGAITADLIAGLGVGIGASLFRAGKGVGAKAAAQVPAIFGEGNTSLERAVIKNTIQGERNALENIVSNFGESQIKGFEQQALSISPNKYTELADASLANQQRMMKEAYVKNNLSIISPLDITPEQGGRAIQESANDIFQTNVIKAEAAAYGSARESAEGLVGEAPKALEEAIKLRDNLIKTTPSGEQNPLVNYLNNFIFDLQVTTPARTIPASNIVGVNGAPLIAEEFVPAITKPKKVSANDMVQMVQNGNQAINYGSEFREQSHRLKPIINTLREETSNVLSKKPEAANAYNSANNLHAKNAETWGTNFMRDVRFTENPENLVPKMTKASNMRNFKEAVPNSPIQGIAERMAVEKITEGGTTATSLKNVANLSPELSPNAKTAANNLIDVKDPLTKVGGKAQIQNEILKETAMAVNSGKRPENLLNLMETPKGYVLVKETLEATPKGKEILNSFERLFIEDIFSSVTDSSGKLNFTKAKNIFKNAEVKQVAEMIGGKGLVQKFEQLEQMALNFEKHHNLYSNPQTQSILKELFKNVKDAGLYGTVLHSLGVPWVAIGAIGLGKAAAGAGKIGFNYIQKRVLSNPKAVAILNQISKSNTIEQLEQQVPRLIAEIERNHDSE